jgi:hypothetical protein
MLGFIISTIAFSIALYALNRRFDAQSLGSTQSRKVLVMTLATIFSIGVGWVVDKVDGDADLPHPSVAEVVQSGDPMQMIKLLAGMN